MAQLSLTHTHTHRNAATHVVDDRAETTPQGTPAAAAGRTQRPDATRGGKDGKQQPDGLSHGGGGAHCIPPAPPNARSRVLAQGITFTDVQTVTLSPKEQYSTAGIRKAIALVRLVDLQQEYVLDDAGALVRLVDLQQEYVLDDAGALVRLVDLQQEYVLDDAGGKCGAAQHAQYLEKFLKFRPSFIADIAASGDQSLSRSERPLACPRERATVCDG